VQVSGNLQTSFDLLGELFKFSRFAFDLFNGWVTDEAFSRLAKLAMSSFVDSNVLVRFTCSVHPVTQSVSWNLVVGL
jgi:uncharacterized protein DUF3689